MRARTLVGVGLILLGGTALGSVLLVRSMLADIEVSKVKIKAHLSLTRPAVRCAIVGNNPLPLSVEVLSYQLELGAGELPVGLRLSSDKPLSVPPGAFEVEAPLVGQGRTAAILLGKGISPSIYRGLGYRGSMLVRVGPFKRTVWFKGVVSWF